MLDRVGVVLAGGKSSRFGTDKFLHVVDGIEMGLHAIRQLQSVVDWVYVAGRRELPASWSAQTLFGPREGSGPLGAIVDAAEMTDSRHLVVVPCDMPNLTSSSIAKLIDGLSASEVDAAFAHSTRLQEPQWLAGCWSVRAVRDQVSALYAGGIRSVREVVRVIPHVLVDLPPEELNNLNESVSS